MRKPKYKPTKFMAKGSYYDTTSADFAVRFVESLKHTKGRWHGKDFKLIGWQEEIIRDIFGILKKNGYFLIENQPEKKENKKKSEPADHQ